MLIFSMRVSKNLIIWTPCLRNFHSKGIFFPQKATYNYKTFNFVLFNIHDQHPSLKDHVI